MLNREMDTTMERARGHSPTVRLSDSFNKLDGWMDRQMMDK